MKLQGFILVVTMTAVVFVVKVFSGEVSIGFKLLAFDVQRDHKGKSKVVYGLRWIQGDFITDTFSFISLAGKCCKNDINFIYSSNTWMQLHSLTPLRLKTGWEVFVGVCVCVWMCVCVC